MKTITFLIILLLASCGAEYDKGFKSTNEIYMQMFLKHVKDSGIAHQEDSHGMLRYKEKDEGKIQEIKTLIEDRLSNKSSLIYKEVEARDYFKKILDSRGMEYTESINNNEIWITWYPKNSEQKETIQMQVVQYMIDLKANTK